MMCFHVRKDEGDVWSFDYSYPYKMFFEEHTVFLYLIGVGVRSQWNELCT